MAVQRFGGFIFIPPITKQTRREGTAKIHKLYNGWYRVLGMWWLVDMEKAVGNRGISAPLVFF